MKSTFRSTFIIYVLSHFLACEKLPMDDLVTNMKNTKDTTNLIIYPKNLKENTWIYAQMKQNYLWESDMPAEEKTDKTQDSTAYFESLLNLNKGYLT